MARPKAVYFDASALVKRYVEEEHSDTVRRWLRSEICATSRLTEIEVASALARRCHEGAFSAADRDHVTGVLSRDLQGYIFRVELTPAVVRRGLGILHRHSLRAADALQLASALELREHLGSHVILVAFDDRLCRAAELEDLAVSG